MERYSGHYMYPEFTHFLARLKAGTPVLICCQDSEGGIITVSDTIKAIIWTGHDDERGQNGVHASVRLATKHRHGARTGSLWGNYFLAMSKLIPSAHATSQRDPDGSYFIEMLRQYGTI